MDKTILHIFIKIKDQIIYDFDHDIIGFIRSNYFVWNKAWENT